MRVLAAIILTLAFALAASAQASPGGYRETNEQVIRHVFGKYGSQAVIIAECESSLSVWARNGQYLGLFQMGDFAREKYGHSYNNAWVQARAAYRYFIASGRDWSPWPTCRWEI
jgi:hypothetical protein